MEEGVCVWPPLQPKLPNTNPTLPLYNPQPQSQSQSQSFLCVVAHPSRAGTGRARRRRHLLCAPISYPVVDAPNQPQPAPRALAAELARCRARLASSPYPSPDTSCHLAHLKSRIRQRSKQGVGKRALASGRAARCNLHLCPSLSATGLVEHTQPPPAGMGDF